MGIAKGNNIDSISYGMRTRPWKSSYKILRCRVQADTTFHGTFREFGATSGYAAPAAGFKVLGFRVVLENGVDTAAVYGGILMSDNDVGQQVATAFTNPVYISGDSVSPSTGASSNSKLPAIGTDLGSGYTVTVGKYLSMKGGGTAGYFIYAEVLIEVL